MISAFQALSTSAVTRVLDLRAQVVADATALLAIQEGEDAARAIADANGAQLVELEWLNEFHTQVEVRVRVDNRESTATAALT